MPDHPMQRKSDQSTVKTLSQLLADYRSIIYPITVLALALGFRFSTPSRRIDFLGTRVDSLATLHAIDHANVQVLVKLQCFNPTFSDEQRAMAGLEGCNVIRQGLPDPSTKREVIIK